MNEDALRKIRGAATAGADQVFAAALADEEVAIALLRFIEAAKNAHAELVARGLRSRQATGLLAGALVESVGSE